MYKACNVQHFVMSSLPNITNASKGRFTKVFHFDNKHKIEQWARDELPAVTALHPGKFVNIQICDVDAYYIRSVLYKHAMVPVLPASRSASKQESSYTQDGNESNGQITIDDGIVRFCAPIDGNKLADWVDPTYDIGVYAAGGTVSSLTKDNNHG